MRIYDQVTSSIRWGALVHDGTGRILSVNDFFCQMLNRQREGLIGTDEFELLDHKDQSSARERMSELKVSGYQPIGFETLTRSPGHLIPCIVDAKLISLHEPAVLVEFLPIPSALPLQNDDHIAEQYDILEVLLSIQYYSGRCDQISRTIIRRLAEELHRIAADGGLRFTQNSAFN